MEGAGELLERYSNGDPPLAIGDFSAQMIDLTDERPDQVQKQNSVVFRYENQGACTWAFGLDADDPPVYVAVESRSKIWTKCAATFSEHLYAWFWDYALVFNQKPLVQAQNAPISPSAIHFLRANFAPGPVTHGWPSHTQYRFSNSDQLIVIWASYDQADWWLKAKDQILMRDLIEKVKNLDGVRNSLWSDDGELASLVPRFA